MQKCVYCATKYRNQMTETTPICNNCKKLTWQQQEYVKKEKEQQLANRAMLAAYGRAEPDTPPLDGLALIVASVVIAVFSTMLVIHADKTKDGLLVGLAGLGIAHMTFLAGVIRWSVSGSQLVQLDRLQRQNAEIIELLEIMADTSGRGKDIEVIRRLRESGQISEDEFKTERRRILSELK